MPFACASLCTTDSKQHANRVRRPPGRARTVVDRGPPTAAPGGPRISEIVEVRARLHARVMPRWLPLLVCLACSSNGNPPAPDAAVARSLDECFAGTARPSRSFIDIQSYTSADGRYLIRRARQPGDRVAVGETFPYDLIRFGMSAPDRVICIDRRSDLSYDFGHHNWNDTMTARTAEASYRIHEQYDVVASDIRWKFTFTILDAAGQTTREGPLPVEDAGCYTLPFDLNGCPGRTRTDR
jgi:hypothetical protein